MAYIHSLCPREHGNYKGHCDALVMHVAIEIVDEKVKGKGSEEFGIGEESMNTSYPQLQLTLMHGKRWRLQCISITKKSMLSKFDLLAWIHPLKDGLLTFNQIHSALQHLHARIERYTTKPPCIAFL